jgi:hypothetical protein
LFTAKIEPAEFLDGKLYAFHRGTLVGDISDTNHCLAAGLFHGRQRFLQRLFRAAVEHKSCAKLCECNCRSLADAFPRAGDYYDAAIKRLLVHGESFLSSKGRDKPHLIVIKKVAARHVWKTIAFRRTYFGDDHPEDGFQQMTRSPRTCKHSG